MLFMKHMHTPNLIIKFDSMSVYQKMCYTFYLLWNFLESVYNYTVLAAKLTVF